MSESGELHTYNVARIDVACACHHSDLGCRGVLQIDLPIRMFDSTGEIEYRQMRQRFVGRALAIFDEFYERVRKDLMTRDPTLLRPRRIATNVALVEVEGMSGNGADPASGDDEDDSSIAPERSNS